MRVISGTAKGKRLKSVPGKGTRPTSDRVKEAMFSAIGPYFSGERVLDLYAGTGGLGIEALSRGCGFAVFVDKDRRSMATVKENLQFTGLDSKAQCLNMSAERAIAYLSKKGVSFDLLFIDPPYHLPGIEQQLEMMLRKQLIQPHALVVLEHDKTQHFPQAIHSLELIKKAEYGSTALSFYRNALEELLDETREDSRISREF